VELVEATCAKLVKEVIDEPITKGQSNLGF